MKKTSILFIMPTLAGGGAEKVLSDILRYMDYDSFNVTLLLIRRKGVYLDSVPAEVTLLSIDSVLNRLPRYIANRFTIKFWHKFIIRHFFKQKKFDVIISFMEGEALRWHQYVLDKGKKNISWIHADLFENHWSARFFDSFEREKAAYSNMDKVVVVSQKAEAQFKKLFGTQITETSVILNLIDRHNIVKKASEPCADIPQKRRFTIVNVGRIDKKKRQDRLLEAIHIIKHDYNIEVDAWIVGQGHLLGELQNQATQLGIQQQIQFLGFKQNPYPYIKQADAFVLSSDTEGFPLVVAEALCLGKAIVSTNVTGPTEMLSTDFGILTEPDAKSLASAIVSLITSPGRAAYYAQRALSRSEMFAPEKTMEQIAGLFSDK